MSSIQDTILVNNYVFSEYNKWVCEFFKMVFIVVFKIMFFYVHAANGDQQALLLSVYHCYVLKLKLI